MCFQRSQVDRISDSVCGDAREIANATESPVSWKVPPPSVLWIISPIFYRDETMRVCSASVVSQDSRLSRRSLQASTVGSKCNMRVQLHAMIESRKMQAGRMAMTRNSAGMGFEEEGRSA